MQLLDVPAGIDQPQGEPIEQTGLDRPQTLRTKIFRRLDQPTAEKVLPVTIHGDACGQRMVGRNQPACQAEP